MCTRKLSMYKTSAINIFRCMFILCLFFMAQHSYGINTKQLRSREEICWKETFFDDFLSKEVTIKKFPGQINCFERIPYCRSAMDLINKCESYKNKLKDLNKCNWIASDRVNLDANSSNTSYFDPNYIEIKNGRIIFTVDKDKFGTYRSGQIDSQGANDVDKDAPIGKKQLYGKFEVYAKFSSGANGGWGAAWLLAHQPQNTPESIKKFGYQKWPESGLWGWPYDGELDVLEFWTNTLGIATQHIHYGDVNIKEKYAYDYVKKVDEVYVKKVDQTLHAPRFYYVKSSFHLYTVEWSPEVIKFSIDNKNTLVVETKKMPHAFDDPMYWILGIGFFQGKPVLGNPLYGVPGGISKQTLEIDWIKNYEKCN